MQWEDVTRYGQPSDMCLHDTPVFPHQIFRPCLPQSPLSVEIRNIPLITIFLLLCCCLSSERERGRLWPRLSLRHLKPLSEVGSVGLTPISQISPDKETKNFSRIKTLLPSSCQRDRLEVDYRNYKKINTSSAWSGFWSCSTIENTDF